MNADQVHISDTPLDIGALYEWALLPECGAVVVFSGTVRDHAEDRTGVTSLTYEAYRDVAKTKMQEVVDEARLRFPSLGRVALVHRLGQLSLTESSVVVVVSAPHRTEAFDAARYCIDALKQSVPIWKKEEWSTGSGWGTKAVAPVATSAVVTGTSKVAQ
jgi:molybdopterin synthase catalytic subunit